MTDLLNIDTGQLRTLHMVYRLNSFSAAADTLGLNQSTVSYAIGRLREAFGDPLFVRQGGAIAATARCKDIVAATERMLGELETLSRPEQFDPAEAHGTITISCNAYERFTLIPPLIRQLRREAPGLRLDIITSFTQGHRHLLDGDADLLISPMEGGISGIYSEPLMVDKYVCVMDRDNPLAGTPMDEETYLAADHLVVTYGGAWRSPYRVALEAQGHTLNQTVGTPSPADLPILLSGTDLVATVPSRLGRHFGDPVHITPCPFPAPVDIRVFWAARLNSSPLIGWLRGALQQIAQTLD